MNTAAADLDCALRDWLPDAYELWWRRGADRVRGGFHERLDLDSNPTPDARRARLHPRQAFAFAQASRFGWAGPAAEAVAHALEYFLARYRRTDGLFRERVAPSGEPLGDDVVLYDQAFALLGFAAGYAALRDARWRTQGIELHAALHGLLAHPTSGFRECPTSQAPLSANSHMHLLECSLVWSEVDDDRRWARQAAALVQLALSHLIQRGSGAIPETFDAQWSAESGAIIDPGHQFEWAWLLLRFNESVDDPEIRRAALRLIEIGETRGVDALRGVAIAALNPDLSMRDREARLWTQCERVRSACRAHLLIGSSRYLRMRQDALRSVLAYLATPVRGLWRDRLRSDGSFVVESAPASSLYHLVGTALELERASSRTG